MNKKVSIIGLGLIGGSMALDLKKSGFASEIIGVDKLRDHEDLALELGIADKILPLDEAVYYSDIIIIATPVNINLTLIPYILDILPYPDKQIVTDVGSTKTSLIEVVKNHPNRKSYVPSHPMAGTEYSGPSAAFHGLFKDKVAIICNTEESFPETVQIVEDLYKNLGSKIVFMNSDAHDEHVGYISHLSHAISYALAVAVLEKEKDDTAIFNLAASGFSSTVRLAKSSVDMWLPIFQQNAKHILPIIETYLDKLTLFKIYLKNGQTEQLSDFIKEANRIKDKLESKK